MSGTYRESNKQVKASRIILGLAIILGTIASFAAPTFAVTYGGGNVQGYAADAPLDNGTIVQLSSKESQIVQVASEKNMANMFGVTVDRSQLLVSSSNDALKNESFVAVSGTYNVIVSNENGPIVSGDYITMSSVNGVGMKADTEQSTVFGRAAASFDGKGITLGTTDLKDTGGNKLKTVSLGSIPVTINIQHNPNVKSTKVKVPSALERVGQAIAEKEVSPIRVYLSLGIGVISLVAAIAILYSGIRSSVISIGRNPMSKKSIFRALLQVVLTAIVILIIGLFAVYLLLKL